MNATITILAVCAGATAVFLAGDYQSSGDPRILILGALEGAAMLGGLAHLLRHAWVD